MKFQGWDLALNHSACVELTDGKLTDYWYITDRAGDAAKGGDRAAYFKKPSKKKQPDPQITEMHRLVHAEEQMALWLARRPDYVGVEHYAMGQATNAYHIGELGGVARSLLWSAGIPFRLIDPATLKMYVAHDGTCQKDEIELSVARRWGAVFSRYNSTDKRQTSEDLADAYGLARMTFDEWCFRTGRLNLSELHEKEVRAFNRITKAMPVSLIDRDWIQDGQE